MYDFSFLKRLRRQELLRIGKPSASVLRVTIDGADHFVCIHLASTDFDVEHRNGRSAATVVYHPNPDELRAIRDAVDAALRWTRKPKKKLGENTIAPKKMRSR